MTKRRTIPTAPEPMETYARCFDDLFGKSNQRDEFRRYLEGLLLPTERNKTLTDWPTLSHLRERNTREPKGCNGFSRSPPGKNDLSRSAACICYWRNQARLPMDKGYW